ncbi:cysteine desulfurase family protein [Brevibacterium litoralis]|uniref:cysteine desulfurase family protein n=1 Tax=Brevibacterium litoralis TaxID=3138935 RepID=UPI0032F08066
MRAYFDHAATSPLRPEVLTAYTAELTRVGNPSSLHAEGQSARMRFETAREDLARVLGASSPAEVLFTSGGTESDNLALKGIFWARNGVPAQAPAQARAAASAPSTHTSAPTDLPRPRILVSTVEHHAVMETAEWLETQGAEVVWLPVDTEGRLDLDAFAAHLSAAPERTALVSVMYANNEIGTLQPLDRVVELAHAHGVPVHTDAVQALGQVPLDFAATGVDAMTVSAHKIGGPVGVGALLLRRDLAPVPVLHGGGQERGVRSGTLDVAGAVAFATAAELVTTDLAAHAARLCTLRDRLIRGIETAVPDARLSGPRPATVDAPTLDAPTPAAGRIPPPTPAAEAPSRLPANVHFTFPGAEGDSMLFLLDVAGFATSTGSACQAGVSRPSHVLMACGRDEDTARSTQRFTLGPDTTEAEIDGLITAVAEAVTRARKAGMVSATPAWMGESTTTPHDSSDPAPAEGSPL